MANAEPPAAPPPPREYTPFAGFLSYLVPGLGQITQGRTGKGLLFLVSIYGLFFYGMYLGTGTVNAAGLEYRVSGNVYLPDTLPPNADPRLVNPMNVPTVFVNLYNRPQFAAQFWVGAAAWPAIVHYLSDDDSRVRREASELRTEAGRLEKKENAAAQAEELRTQAERMEKELQTGTGPGNPVFGQFERAPSEEALNALNTSRGKELELGWVYTVVAGVLNIMVIYDAIAGPAFPAAPKPVMPEGGA
jgi:hypothetical protein